MKPRYGADLGPAWCKPGRKSALHLIWPKKPLRSGRTLHWKGPLKLCMSRRSGEGGYRAAGTSLCESCASCQHARGHAEPRVPAGDRALAGPGPPLPHFWGQAPHSLVSPYTHVPVTCLYCIFCFVSGFLVFTRYVVTWHMHPAAIFKHEIEHEALHLRTNFDMTSYNCSVLSC